MINVVLLNPHLFLSFFHMPKWVEKEIDSLRRRFLWNGMHKEGRIFNLIRWERACKRKEFEGLGVINLRDFNTTLFIKWWWKLFSNPANKWALLIAHQYHPLSSWWADKCISAASFSYFWRGLIKVKKVFLVAVSMAPGNSLYTRFWSDRWCSGVSLDAFLYLFCAAKDRNGSLAAYFGESL